MDDLKLKCWFISLCLKSIETPLTINYIFMILKWNSVYNSNPHRHVNTNTWCVIKCFSMSHTHFHNTHPHTHACELPPALPVCVDCEDINSLLYHFLCQSTFKFGPFFFNLHLSHFKSFFFVIFLGICSLFCFHNQFLFCFCLFVVWRVAVCCGSLSAAAGHRCSWGIFMRHIPRMVVCIFLDTFCHTRHVF